MALDYLTTDSDSPTSYLDPDLMAQQDALTRRRAELVARAKASAEGAGIYATPEAPANQPGWTSGVNGARMLAPQTRIGALQAIAPILADVGRTVADSNFERDQSGYNRLSQAAVSQHMEAKPADDAPLRDKLAWAQKGTQIPALAPLMADYSKDVLIAEPDRAASRAATAAEAQRKQQDELQYRRERDAQAEALRRDLAQQQSDLRRDLHAAVAAHSGGGAGGEKASDYQIIQGDDGSVYRVGKKPGSPMERVEGASGKSSATQQKDVLETRGQIERSTSAINNAPKVEKLLGEVPSSGLSSDVRRAAGYFGYSDAATKAERAIKPLADIYLKSVPRFEGPQSDKDVQTYKDAAANLADPHTTPEDRRAALQTVITLHRQAINQARSRGNQPASPRVPPQGNAQPAQAPSSNVSDDDLIRMYSK